VSTYRTGRHWRRTIIRVGTQPPDADGRRTDDELVGVMDDPALAERICELLNARIRPNHQPVTCTRCGGLIQHVDAPPIPEGWGSAGWEGWFHLDRDREHFKPVGWVR